jgi:hypothetical protein
LSQTTTPEALAADARAAMTAPYAGIRDDNAAFMPPGVRLTSEHNIPTGPNMEGAGALNPGNSMMQNGADASLLSTYADAFVPGHSTVLSDSLPVDVAALESAIREFFAHFDIFANMTEGESQFISAGIVVVAGAMAVEIARRRLQRRTTPAFVGSRETVPYSDVP